MGLKANTGKTEVMVVDSFRYLGVSFGSEGRSEKAVRARVKAAWPSHLGQKDTCKA